MPPTDERFREVFNRLEAYVERRWEIPVVITDVTDPYTGDLDGAQILVDYADEVEVALFILVHLFGHTVQWNTNERARSIGGLTPQTATPEALAEVEAYETEACRYALTLLHDAGVHDLDQWLADFARCDFAYLRHFYSTGEKLPWRGCWRDGGALLEPLAIPDFTPTRWTARSDGVVV